MYWLVISLMRTKVDHYALPLVLPAAVLLGRWVASSEPAGRWDRFSAWVCGLVGLLLAVLGTVALAGAVPLPSETRLPAAALAGLLGAAYLGCSVAASRGLRPHGWAVLLGAAVVAYAVGGVALRPWDAEPGLRAVADQLPRNAQVTYVAEAPPEVAFCPYSALRFRLDRPPRVLSPEQLGSAGPGWYVGREGVLHPAPRDRVVFRGSGWVLVRRPD